MSRRSTISWLELIIVGLLIVGGQAIYRVVEDVVDAASLREQAVTALPDREAALLSLARIEAERKALLHRYAQKQLAAVELEVLIEETRDRYPGLSDPQLGSPPPEIVAEFAAARESHARNGRLLAVLDARLERISGKQDDLREGLAEAKKAAEQAEAKKRERQDATERRQIRVAAYALCLGFLVVTFLGASLAGGRRARLRYLPVFTAVAAVLVVFALVGIAGYAAVALGVAVLLIPLLVRVAAKEAAE